ncbi:39S ribosomal protein L44-like protein [Dinothrombium tinctorium]|nr:39S ribosomal protein L44-like protein [Dinothrombium tinctorium]RWS09529.1 39S ribosomal protein L44-like protein [Dinothrombium tinctorium]
MYWRAQSYDAIPHPERHRREWQNWNYKSELFAFSQRLSEKFSEEMLRVCFTDKSYVEKEDEQRKELGMPEIELRTENNSELAAIGTNKLTPFIKSYLRYFLKNVPEECISAVHNYLMSDTVLADIASKIGCTQLILCNAINPSDEVKAQVLRALIGALMKEKGEKHTEKFIIDFILTYINDQDIMEVWNLPQAEIALSNVLKNNGITEYEPRLLRESGRNTIYACFMVGMYVDKKLIGFGSGETVSIAREMAAYDALRRMFKLTPASTLFKFGKDAYNIDFGSSSQEYSLLNEWKLLDLDRKHQLKSIS